MKYLNLRWLRLPGVVWLIELVEWSDQSVTAMVIQWLAQIRHLDAHGLVKPVDELWQTLWVPVDWLQKLLHRLRGVVPPVAADPRMPLTGFKYEHPQSGFHLAPEVLAERWRDRVALRRQTLGRLVVRRHVNGVDEAAVVEYLGDQSVKCRPPDAALVAHVLDNVSAQVLDAQQVGGLPEDVAQRPREPLLLAGPDHCIGTDPDFGAGDSAVEQSPDCGEEPDVRLILFVPVKQHRTHEGRMRSGIVADDGSTSIDKHGDVARAEVGRPVHAKDRLRPALVSVTAEATHVCQLLVSVQKNGRRLAFAQANLLDERVRV